MYTEKTFNKNRCLQLLRSAGVAEAEVEFSGGNDEGGVDSITLIDSNGNSKEIDFWSNTVESERELVEQLCAPVYNQYFSFAGEFHVNGTVYFNVEAETVRMSKDEQEYVHHDYDY